MAKTVPELIEEATRMHAPGLPVCNARDCTNDPIRTLRFPDGRRYRICALHVRRAIVRAPSDRAVYALLFGAAE